MVPTRNLFVVVYCVLVTAARHGEGRRLYSEAEYLNLALAPITVFLYSADCDTKRSYPDRLIAIRSFQRSKEYIYGRQENRAES